MGLKEDILQRGAFSSLNAMQETMLTTGLDKLVLIAPTGSGKTVAFIIWLSRHLKKDGIAPQALILVPSRELALQVTGVAKTLLPLQRTVALYGGHAFKDEENSLAGQLPDIVVATPGRLLDHLSKNTVDTSCTSTLIIDEMDKCLEEGFSGEMNRILKRLPELKNVLLASATLLPDNETPALLRNLTVIDFRENQDVTKPSLSVIEVPSQSNDKLETLELLLGDLDGESKKIVFANHRESAERIFEFLKRKKFPATLYHGGLQQDERELAVITLRNGTTPVLVSTDLAGRGLDVPEVDSVIHYHIPPTQEIYTHRNGRTARAGQSGNVYILRSENDDLPPYIEFDRQWYPGSHSENNAGSSMATLLFNIGKRDKISKGDVLGFLVKQGELSPGDIGKIDIADRYAAAAVKKDTLNILIPKISGTRLKSKRFKLSVIE